MNQTFQAQIEEILRNIEPALENMFLKKKTCIQQVNTRYKMNEIVIKSLLAGDKFMPEIHLRQPGFTYSASGSFNLKKQKIRDIFIKTN